MSNIIKSSYVIIQNPQNTGDSKKVVKPISEITPNTTSIVNEAYAEKEKILNDAIEESKKIINSANEYKNSILAAVTKEIEIQKKKGFDIGHTEGYEKGFLIGQQEGRTLAEEQVNKKNEDLVAELCKQIYTVDECKDEIINKFEKDLIKLSIEIAEKIIRTQINGNDSIIKNMIKNAIKDYKNVEWVKIYLSGNDYITISTDKDIMQRLSQISQHVSLEVMADVTDGELIIETPENLIDSGVNTQLSNLKSIVLGA